MCSKQVQIVVKFSLDKLHVYLLEFSHQFELFLRIYTLVLNKDKVDK